MDIMINTNTIIGLAGLLTALGVLFGSLRKTYKTIDKWDSYDKKSAIQTKKSRG